MGFMDEKQPKEKKASPTYLEADATPKRVRPLAKVPSSRWIHVVNNVEAVVGDKKQVLRYFFTLPCTSVNKSGAGCDACVSVDPLWDKLQPRHQTNAAGKPVHFPKRQQFELPVWDYDLNDVRIVRGKQVFENMNTWWDTRKSDADKDVTKLDWFVSCKGDGERRKWAMNPGDPEPFDFNAEVKVKLAECMKRAAEDAKPLPSDEFRKKVNARSTGDSGSEVDESEMFRAAPNLVATQPPSKPHEALQTKAAAVPTTSSTGATGATALSKWISEQPEFVGPNLTVNLLPALKTKLGTYDYQKLGEAELADLKAYLEGVLVSLRVK